MDGVISVFRSRPSRLHTTRSWDFISLLEANWDASAANLEALLKKANYGQNVTVAMVDSGISFLSCSRILHNPSIYLIHNNIFKKN